MGDRKDCSADFRAGYGTNAVAMAIGVAMTVDILEMRQATLVAQQLFI
jgi:hypothetical protein